jgi:hypothetical protein
MALSDEDDRNLGTIITLVGSQLDGDVAVIGETIDRLSFGEARQALDVATYYASVLLTTFYPGREREELQKMALSLALQRFEDAEEER